MAFPPLDAGSSSLTLPYIFMKFGLLSGLAFLFLGASLTFYSYHLLVAGLELTHSSSYEELVGKVLGKRMVPFHMKASILASRLIIFFNRRR